MITSDMLQLVPLERRHKEKTREWANDPEISLLMDRAFPVSDEEHDRWFTSLIGRKDVVYFAIHLKNGGNHVGNVWLCDIDWRHRRTELRIVIGENSERSRGVGADAIRLAVRYAFERLNMNKVYAYVLSSNPRAKRSFEKAGFQEEALLKKDRWFSGLYIDVHLLSRWNEPA